MNVANQLGFAFGVLAIIVGLVLIFASTVEVSRENNRSAKVPRENISIVLRDLNAHAEWLHALKDANPDLRDGIDNELSVLASTKGVLQSWLRDDPQRTPDLSSTD